jgi:bifunctional DNase/RNase
MDPASNMRYDSAYLSGMYEANAIALEIEKSATPRPMTHALLNNLVRDLNTSVQKCVLAEFKTIRFTL